MRKTLNIIILGLAVFTTCRCGGKSIPDNKKEQIEQFLRNVVVETQEENYHRHNIGINVVVTKLKVDTITQEETDEYVSYFARGSVSYVIKGKRKWKDKEGNLIQLDPEGEITHWFSCGILEDRYGDLLKDSRNRLTFYADNPVR
jgi:hypothetical protein